MRAWASSSCSLSRSRSVQSERCRPNTSSSRPSRTFRLSRLIPALSSRTASAYTPLPFGLSSRIGDPILGEQRRRERIGIERRQVVGLLTEADVPNRQSELAADGERHPPFGGAVELGQHHGRHPQRLVEG